MVALTALLDLAHQRAVELDLPYQGALTPAEAYQVWQSAPGAKLIDIRTQAELNWVGRVPGTIDLEWASWPGMQPHHNFMAQLRRQVDREALVMFLCRSGVRSDNAARIAVNAGYNNCYNVLEGFEGDRDADNQRGHIGGWKHAGLPWQQD
ncbi:sulfurtransferase [Betaproteobacteria bacterium]|nr:sulfurtransferase [Betaproteobacteria bacterium]GHT95079.1 sulfurtransferase [Betaproteobacteria bacterium]GHT99578.1 sulfurtransferase [Betaproteobacteria bacterium]GHU12506.1 sulfurtransferase [Betaproteobacteria bacterium]GHU22300.1 sulfurtransferase [Betaproteobacteria bacterium]